MAFTGKFIYIYIKLNTANSYLIACALPEAEDHNHINSFQVDISSP